MRMIFGGALVLGLIGSSLAVAQAPQGEQGATAAAPRPPRPPDVVARSMPIDLAVEAGKAVVSACAGFHVGVAILDQAGLPKLYYVADGTAGFHANTAFRKASTALLIKAPSEGLKDRIASDQAISDKVNADKDNNGRNKTYVSQAGGLPIVVNDEVIGAIGVSGAEPSAKDEECAAAGLKSVQSQLK